MCLSRAALKEKVFPQIWQLCSPFARLTQFTIVLYCMFTSFAVADIPISWTLFSTSNLKSFEYNLFPEFVWIAPTINPPLLCTIMWLFRFFLYLNDFPHTSQLTGSMFWCCFWWPFKALGSEKAFPHSSQQWGFSPVCWRVWICRYCLVE